MNISIDTTVSSLDDRLYLSNRQTVSSSKDTVVLTLIFIPFIYIINTQWDVTCKIKVSMFDM